MDTLKSLMLGAAGASFVRLFFAVVRTEWPASYTLVSSPAEREQRRHLIKFLIVRVSPVILVAIFVLTTAARIHGSTWYCFWAFVLVELSFSALLGAVRLVRTTRITLGRRIELFLYYAGNCALVILATLLAQVVRSALAPIVPQPHELPAALWTGIFAAVIAVSLRRFTQASDDPADIPQHVKDDIGADLLRYAREASAQRSCDGDLMEAILLAECEQRPSWFRALERLKGKVVKAGTYGVAQVSASRPLSDSESIDELCRRFAGFYPSRNSNGTLRTGVLEARLELHNPDDAFIGRVMRNFESITGRALFSCSVTAPDMRPEIIVGAIERNGMWWTVSGSEFTCSSTLVASYCGDRRSGEVSSTVTGVSGARRAWLVRVPIEALVVSLAPAEAPHDQQRTAEVDLSYY